MMRTSSFFSVLTALALGLTGCPATGSGEACRSEGTCPPGTTCTTDAECADDFCDFVDAEDRTTRTCLDECASDGRCPSGYVCQLGGGTGYCRVDHAIIPDGGGRVDAGSPVDSGTPVDAPVAGACPSAGAMRVVPCGNCGMQSQQCSAALVWESVGACLGQGECAAGTNETMMTARCGERQRICGADCSWGAWEQTAADGECEPGTDFCGVGLEAQWCCDATCHRISWPQCRMFVPCPSP